MLGIPNPLFIGIVNSADSDEMPHGAASNQVYSLVATIMAIFDKRKRLKILDQGLVMNYKNDTTVETIVISS